MASSWQAYLGGLPNDAPAGLSYRDKGLAAAMISTMPPDQKQDIVGLLCPGVPAGMAVEAIKGLLEGTSDSTSGAVTVQSLHGVGPDDSAAIRAEMQLSEPIQQLPARIEEFQSFLGEGRIPVNAMLYNRIWHSWPHLAPKLINKGANMGDLVTCFSACLSPFSTPAAGHFFGSVLSRTWDTLDKHRPMGAAPLARGMDMNTKPSNTSVTVGNIRPDFLLTVEGLLLAAGKERTSGGELEATRDLQLKFTGGLPRIHYQDTPYIPLYIACGCNVRFGLLYANGTLRMCKPAFDISRQEDLVCALLACINLYRLVGALLNKAPVVERRVPLLVPMERPHRTLIIHQPKTVEKFIYEAEAFFERFGNSFEDVKAAYEVAKGSPFMVQSLEPPTLKAGKRRTWADGATTGVGQVYKAVLSTIGWVRCMSSLTEEDLKAAVHAALHGLDRMHRRKTGGRRSKRAPLVLRDMRLTNVLWGLNKPPFLIDFELAAKANLKPPEGVVFTDWDPDTLDGAGHYTCTSDIHQVGVMMAGFTEELSDAGRAFMDELLAAHSSGLTAAAALGSAWLACPGGDG